MTDLNLFLSQCQSMIVAPAGYGKTHSIAECINICSGQKTCLILTHTHAGIASLKEKLQFIQSSNSNYELATICGFTLNIAQAYHQDRKDFPDIENSPNDYYRFAIETSIRILKAKPIYSTLQLKYSHVIVDEYQDCSILQHKFIKVLSQYIPTHILGDPLQSIFKFDGACADLNNIEQMEGFFNNKQTLETPWRWKKNKCEGLGNDLKNIREKLENNKIINIDEYKNISTLYADSGSLYQHGTLYSKLLWREIFNNQSLLVIHPKSESKNFRLKIIKSYPKLRLIEALDDKDFYTYSSAFDSANKKNILALILRLSRKVFKKTVIDNWFNNSDKLKTKRNINDKAISLIIKNYIGILERDINPINIYNFLYYIHHLPENACYRTELMNDIYKALKKAQTDKITISDAIKQNRDILRQIGRKVEGRCIGTTLLTKGLEFDTVVVLNFQEFEDRNNFYVAITRACKKLILIGNTHNIHFNNFSSE